MIIVEDKGKSSLLKQLIEVWSLNGFGSWADALPGYFAVRVSGPAVDQDAPAGGAVLPTTVALAEEEKVENRRLWEI